MTTLSAPFCMSCRSWHLEVSEPVAPGLSIARVLVDVALGSFQDHRSDPIRDAWARVEPGLALRREAVHG